VIAAVGTLRVATDRGLAAEGRRILGGDLEVESGSQPLPDALPAWLRARGARLSGVVQMRSMLVAASGQRQLVELKAVDAAWPLVGEVQAKPAQPLAAALSERDGRYGLLAERVVLDRLGLRPGDVVRLGNASFVLRGELVSEPDRVAAPLMLGPRVLIAAGALAETGLIVPGSMVQYAVRASLADPAATPGVIAALRETFRDTGWRIREPRDAAPGVTRFIDRTSLFMTLVGLTSLLVGGIGVANGTRAWLEARARTIATLRCLGAASRLVFAVCLIQVLALSVCGILLGLVVGTLLPIALVAWLKDVLPVPPVLGVYPGPVFLAGCYGLLTALAFSIGPLDRAARIPGAALFRDALIPQPARAARWLNVGVAAALVGLTIETAADRGFAVWFCAAALATLALFRLGGCLVMLAARAGHRVRSASGRLGLANLHRPGAATQAMLVSVGLGLSTLAAVALIQGNVRREIFEQMPADAPSFFFVDIQDDQLARFEAVVRGQPGVEEWHQVPNLRARIVSVNGIPADQVQASEETRWALRGDRGLTYAAAPPPGTRIVAGTWWPADYGGPPLVSLDAALARGWGIGVGGTIRVNVLGRDIDLRIASLRDIAWRSLGLNFAMVTSPGLLAHAPHTHIASVRVAGPDQGSLLRAVTDMLPNVTGIRVEEVLAAVAALLDQVAAALAATGSLTLLAGALVLVGAVAAGQRRRTQEAVILKTLGATRRQIRTAWLVEFGVLGLAAGLIAAVVGTLASFGVVRYVMHAGWVFLPGTLAGTLIVSLAMMLGFGYIGTAAALRAKAAPMLRNE